MALLSVVQQFGEKWQLLGDLQYTHWSTIGTVNVVNTNNGADARTSWRFDFDNAWRFALGVNYLSSEKWTFRGGVAWDQSPVNDQNRTVRLPDNDRYLARARRAVQVRQGRGAGSRLRAPVRPVAGHQPVQAAVRRSEAC